MNLENDKLIGQIESGDLNAFEKLIKNLVSDNEFQTAFEWLQKGANLGHVVSMANLAQFYAKGIATNQDFNLALTWFVKADCLGAQMREHVFRLLGEETLSYLAQSGNANAEYYYALWVAKHNNTPSAGDQLLIDAANKKTPLALGAVAIKEFLNHNPDAKRHFLEAIDYGYDYYALLRNLDSTDIVFREKNICFSIADLVRFIIEEQKENRQFVAVKITKSEYAEALVKKGEVFTQSLDSFRKSKQAGVGDDNEGLDSTGYNSIWQELQIEEAVNTFAGLGIYDEYMAHERLYCLYALEWDEEGKLVKPDFRMKQFGDTVVVILNVKEFFNRLSKKVQEAHGDVWIGFDRVHYSVRYDHPNRHGEFSKTEPYAWQSECRFVLDIANGRIERSVWDKTEPSRKSDGSDYTAEELAEMSVYERMQVFTHGMTDFAKLQLLEAGFSGKTYDDPGREVFRLGSMEDICEVFPIDAFLELTPEFVDTIEKSINRQWRVVPEHKKPFVLRPIIKL